ncbi:hypothetical protein [Burkholderia plantarii]|uniref:hypothetical protein n=1 Tax=Burkholderia plantarii TaxID=41899 RepID=UPI0014955220|nr:hypothetical protein [Burkholderia plantarii]
MHRKPFPVKGSRPIQIALQHFRSVILVKDWNIWQVSADAVFLQVSDMESPAR